MPERISCAIVQSHVNRHTSQETGRAVEEEFAVHEYRSEQHDTTPSAGAQTPNTYPIEDATGSPFPHTTLLAQIT